ncbi:tRNA (adenosine(37)-N6)-threonylcarbamoyltransferase complex dimerization subunit type 1 TsaB [Hyphobacterium sp. CCMP332]|nr:tRNA (adenosine(37)-N6)-threonylcarbamoyltransferase complex dimerization subunit type 1 TsaB [Hyphobacterium sp. CCMP332]
MEIGLCIETSDEICSVALNDSTGQIHTLESNEPKSHARVITKLITQILNKAGLEISKIDFVAVSSGPGSYTGLRIGISTAKGICYTLNKPLIAIDVFEIIKKTAIQQDLINDKIPFAMIDARRMEVYAQKWRKDLTKEGFAFPLILDETFLLNEKIDKLIFIGSGAKKVNLIKDNLDIEFFDIRPHAKYMLEMAIQKFKNGETEDVAYFEPFYLKEFYITKPKNVLKTGNGERNSK